jgi:hypothetical protein
MLAYGWWFHSYVSWKKIVLSVCLCVRVKNLLNYWTHSSVTKSDSRKLIGEAIRTCVDCGMRNEVTYVLWSGLGYKMERSYFNYCPDLPCVNSSIWVVIVMMLMIMMIIMSATLNKLKPQAWLDNAACAILLLLLLLLLLLYCCCCYSPVCLRSTTLVLLSTGTPGPPIYTATLSLTYMLLYSEIFLYTQHHFGTIHCLG